MKAEYAYDDAGRLTETRYGTGTPVNKTFREYDEANRLTEIRHEDAASSVLRLRVENLISGVRVLTCDQRA